LGIPVYGAGRRRRRTVEDVYSQISVGLNTERNYNRSWRHAPAAGFLFRKPGRRLYGSLRFVKKTGGGMGMLLKEKIYGQEIVLETSDYYFSPKSIDKGTLFMLSKVQVIKDDKVLDLGCGYGVVGIYVAKLIGGEHVIMSDVSDEALWLTIANLKLNKLEQVRVLKSNGLKEIPDNDFTLILSNPPYHADFSVAKAFIEDGYKRLVPNGRLIMVTKRLTWYRNKITAVFGGVKVFEQDGYYVFVAEKRRRTEKRSEKKKQELSKKLMRKYGNKEKKLSRKEA
jgi:16S rRNA (guanine1207-N2)-methyltransferase